MRRLVVVGPGLVGGSLGLAARASGRWRVVAVGRDREEARAAVRAGAADEWARSLTEALAGAPHPETPSRAPRRGPVVCLAVPLAAMEGCLAEAFAQAGPGALVTDTAGVKRAVHAEADACRRAAGCASPAFVGGHPMAGRELGGLGAARADLFQGAAWVLTDPEPEAARRTPAGRLAERLVRDAGAHPVWLTPEAHDRAVAAASQLPQVLALALAALVAEDPLAARIGGGGLRDMTRLAASPADIWTEALLANADALAPILDRLAEQLRAFGRALRAGDRAAVAAAFEAGNDARRRLAAARGWSA